MAAVSLHALEVAGGECTLTIAHDSVSATISTMQAATGRHSLHVEMTDGVNSFVSDVPENSLAFIITIPVGMKFDPVNGSIYFRYPAA